MEVFPEDTGQLSEGLEASLGRKNGKHGEYWAQSEELRRRRGWAGHARVLQGCCPGPSPGRQLVTQLKEILSNSESMARDPPGPHVLGLWEGNTFEAGSKFYLGRR